MGNEATRLSKPSAREGREEARVFREWGMKPRVVDVDLVNIPRFLRGKREETKEEWTFRFTFREGDRGGQPRDD